ncbi:MULTISPECIES: flagellar assembly protein FliH [unclassified Pusillimonas]|uniref:flagellar assembly protein FliH n=1 Tax=unclassified Pusillimonas TaxID=2640016 RepID=UPI000B9C8B57|nr:MULTISPECIES: flagellar assembly protein FliH [unclassified Pusillimonas]OXR49682.1 flagellar assembly protein FliH [Pusillimonas sp. T2]ROT45085.1 hypothetical protein CHR62_09580 [Pusillimonas sp. NJUB218]
MSDTNHDHNDPGTWQRWEMTDLGNGKPTASAPGGRLARRLAEEKTAQKATSARQPVKATNDIPEDVVAQVARIGQEARERAVQEGREAGLKQGHAEGFAAGKAEGLKSGHDEGFQAGHREGYEKGLAEGRAISATEVGQIQSVAQSCAASVNALNNQVAESLVDLALNIARQVIRSTIAASPEAILDTVRDILATDSGEGKGLMRLRMHPEDLTLVKRHLSDDPRMHHWHLEADPRIERGGCYAETSLGDIDATLKTRWERIAGTLREAPAWDTGND